MRLVCLFVCAPISALIYMHAHRCPAWPMNTRAPGEYDWFARKINDFHTSETIERVGKNVIDWLKMENSDTR